MYPHGNESQLHGSYPYVTRLECVFTVGSRTRPIKSCHENFVHHTPVAVLSPAKKKCVTVQLPKNMQCNPNGMQDRRTVK